MKKPTAIVLGGTTAHGAVIQNLNNRGYKTVLVDYFDQPPAAEFCDVHLKDSAMDLDAVCRIANEYDADLILSPCLDQQMTVAIDALEKLGKYTPFDHETVINVTNKPRMKEIMWENNIPTSRFYIVDSLSEVGEIRYPIIVKPADSNGSAGVSVLEQQDDEQLEEAIKKALKWSHSGKAVVEEFVVGTEVSGYSFISEGKCTLFLTAQRLTSFEDEESIKCYCTLAPAQISKAAWSNMETVGDMIAKAFKLDNTPLFFQCIVSGENVDVIEFSARLGGGLSFRTVKEWSGFDLLDAAIDSWAGKKVDVSKHESNKHYLIHLIHGKDCIYDHLENVDELISEGIIDELYEYKWKGAEISNEKASSSRIGAFIASDESVSNLPEKAQKAIQMLRVIDDNGEDRTLDELYLKKEMIITE